MYLFYTLQGLVCRSVITFQDFKPVPLSKMCHLLCFASAFSTRLEMHIFCKYNIFANSIILKL